MAFAPTVDRVSRRSLADTRPDIRRQSIAHTLGAGLVAGQTAGLAMTAALMALTTVAGGNLFAPVQALGAFLRGGSSIGGMDAMALVSGLAVVQLGPALAWGFAFGVVVAVVHPRSATALLLLGLAFGALAQVVDVYILLPRIAAELHVPNYWAAHVHPAVSWLAHLVFGLFLSIFPWKYDPVGRSFA